MRRRFWFILIMAALGLSSFAQDGTSKFSISTRIFLDQLSGKIETNDAPQRARALGLKVDQETLKGDHFVAKPDTINGIVYMSAFVRIDDSSAIGDLESLGVIVQEQFLDGKLVTALIPVDKIEDVAAIAKVNRIKAATMMRKATDKARQKTNVDDVLTYSVDAQSAGLPYGFDGSGVILGVIDTGVDFQHIAFKDKNGNSRIKRAYVYTGSGNGTEYSTITSSSPTTDDSSEDHGTHTCSTAGGSSVIMSGTNGATVTVTDEHDKATYGGMAPGADLYLAGVNGLSDTHLANAVNNMCTYANQQGKPLVVSNSWGSQYGPHDGTGDVADIYNDLFGDNHPNRIALFASSNDAGNAPASEGGGYHVGGTTSSNNPLGTIVRSQYYSDTDNGYYYTGPIVNAWFRSTVNVNDITVKVLVLNSSTGAKLAETTVTPTTDGATVSGLSSYYSGTLYALKDLVSSEGKTQIMLYAQGLTTRSASNYVSNYTLAVQIYPNNGSATIDMWGGNYCYFTDYLTTSGYNWTDGSDDMCVSDEATIANVISIGAYVSKNSHVDYTGTTQSSASSFPTIGEIAGFSSYATASKSPTGLQYPWITAPGARLVAAVNHYHTSGNYNYINGSYAKTDRVNANTTSPYAAMQGTSMATPTAAGIVALWLQASKDENAKSEYQNLTVNQVKQLMAQTAIHDSYTDGGTYSNRFGNGKIDALAGIEEILDNANPRITATPTELAFDDTYVGDTPAPTKTFTVTGTNLEGNITATLSGGNGAFALSSNTITAAEAANGKVITVTFNPSAAGNYTGTITLASSNAESVTVSLSGTGKVHTPVITATPTSLSFGTVNVGSNGQASFTVSGEYLTGNITATLTDANNVFALSSNSITTAEAANGKTITVTFTPSGNGTYNGSVQLASNGATAVTVNLSGTGHVITPTINVSSNALAFDATYVNESSTKKFTVTGADLSDRVVLTLNDPNNVFSLSQQSVTAAVAMNGTGREVTVTFAPQATGDYSATVTLTSTGAATQTVTLNASAVEHLPALTASTQSISFGNVEPDEQAAKTFTLNGEYLLGDVTLTLNDATGKFSISDQTITKAQAEEGKTVTVNFAATEETTYNATITVSTSGLQDITISLSAEVSSGGTASDAYLDIAKYATIDDAGWNHSLVNNLYTFTEYDDEEVAWLTLPMYGAFVGAKYSTTNSTAFTSDPPQKWITTSVSASNQCASTTWDATDVYLGSSNYFTSATAKAVGTNSQNSTTEKSVTFYVKNTTAVKLYASQRSTSTRYPTTLKIYECDESLNANSTATKEGSRTTSGAGSISLTGLDATKIYKVVASQARGYLYEIGFQTPNIKPSLKATPNEVSIRTAPGETGNATFNVKGKYLTNDVTVALTDANGVFSVTPTSITAAEAMEGKDVTVHFNSNDEGTFTGTVTLTSGELTATVNLSATCRDGGTASDAYLNIAKYATIDEAGATVSGMETIYQYTEYPEDEVAWLTLSNYGAKQAASTQNWIATTSLNSYNNSWDATDIFMGSTSYFGSSQGYSIYGSNNQQFFVTNCTQVKALVKDGSNYKATLAIYECQDVNGTLNASTTAFDSQQGGASGLAVITSAALDASKIYKVQLTGGGSYPDLLEMAFCTPCVKPTLTASPTGFDIMARPGQTATGTITLTGKHLEENVAVTVTDPNGVYSVDKSNISIAEAEAGTTVTVTLNAPLEMGSYRALVEFTSGEATAHTYIYGVVGEEGTAYSDYLDIAKYSSIGSRNWYEGIFANAYKYQEYENEEVPYAWLTIPAALPYYAWNYNDQDWCGVSSSATGGWYGHQWTGTAPFQGYEYFKSDELSDEDGDYAHMMGPNVSSSEMTSNTTMFYGVYNVTNCTQVKAYGYNNSTLSSTYASFIQIYELEEQDGQLVRSDTRTDIQTSTTSGAFTLESATLDANKKYFVAVGGYRGFTYEVAFKTPLDMSEHTLADIVDEPEECKTYRVVKGDLTAVEISDDGMTLYCKDNSVSKDKVEPTSSDVVDYIARLTTLMTEKNNTYDENNWVALTTTTTGGFSTELLGHRLESVKGILTDVHNPTIALSGTPAVYTEDNSVYNYTLNTFIVPSFGANEQVGTDGKTYFFVNPKPMEVATVAWAMWDADSECFVTPTKVGSSNQAGLEGSINVEGIDKTALDDGGIYSFTALIQKSISTGATTSSAPRRAPGDNGYTVYALETPHKDGSINDGVITDINKINADGDVLRVVYSNPAGQVSSHPWKGVNIVVTIYTNGKRTVTKRMF